MHREGMEKGSAVFPQVSPRPLSFSMNMVEPFTLNTSPVFAELMAGTLDDRVRAYADPAWRQRVRDAWASGPQGGLPPRWETYELMESTANPELIGRRLLGVAEERGVDPFDLLLDLAVAEPTLKDIRVKAVARQRRRGRRAHAAPGGRLHARPVRRRRPRQPAVRRPAGDRPARPTGCARRAC